MLERVPSGGVKGGHCAIVGRRSGSGRCGRRLGSAAGGRRGEGLRSINSLNSLHLFTTPSPCARGPPQRDKGACLRPPVTLNGEREAGWGASSGMPLAQSASCARMHACPPVLVYSQLGSSPRRPASDGTPRTPRPSIEVAPDHLPGDPCTSHWLPPWAPRTACRATCMAEWRTGRWSTKTRT